MNKHLQTLVLAEVEGGGLIYGLRLSLLEVLYGEVESLLVVLNQLWL